MRCEIIRFEEHGDERGNLIALENNSNIPFEIKRVYYIFDTKEGVRRGFHAHYTLKQVLIAVHGSCKIDLNDGKEKKTILLNNCREGLYIDMPLWREMYDFSEDCVLMCVASEIYDEKDYIRDFNQYLTFIRGAKLK